MDVLGVSLWVPWQLVLLTSWKGASVGRWMALRLARSWRIASALTLALSSSVTTRGVQAVVGELLDKSIGPIIRLIWRARRVWLLRRNHSSMSVLLLLAILLLRLLLRVWVVHEIALVIHVGIHVILPALVGIHRLREGRGGGRVSPIIVLRGKLAVVETEVQVQMIAVRIHLSGDERL